GTLNNPAIRFTRGTVFAATLVRNCCGLSGCWPPCTDLTGLPANGGFYFQAFDRSVALPVAGYNYNSVWTPLLAGLPPAGMAASVAALVRPCSSPASRPSWPGGAEDKGAWPRLWRLARTGAEPKLNRRPHDPWQDIKTRQSLSALAVRSGRLGRVGQDQARGMERYGLKSWIESAKQRLHRNLLAIALANK